MTKMKRTFAFVTALVGLTLAAGSASALSSISLIWFQTGTATIDTATFAPSSTVTAQIILQGDSTGVAGVFVSILFDPTELQADLSQVVYEQPGKVSKGNVFLPISAGVTVDNVNGQILGFDSTVGLATGCISCTVQLGTVVFHVVSGATDGIDAVTAVLDNGIDAIVPAGGGTTTAQHNGASVDGAVVPEPTTALLVVGGLLGLGYAGRRSIR